MIRLYAMIAKEDKLQDDFLSDACLINVESIYSVSLSCRFVPNDSVLLVQMVLYGSILLE